MEEIQLRYIDDKGEEKYHNIHGSARVLDLRFRNVQKINLKPISAVPNLSKIDLSNNHLEEVNFPRVRFPVKLRSVLLHNNELHQISFGNRSILKSVVEFNLSNNQLGYQALHFLYYCPNLKRLILSFNKIQEDARNFLSFSNKLEILDLGFNIIRRVDSYFWGDAMSLKWVSLAGNKLVKLDLSPLGRNRNLEKLYLQSNPIRELDVSPLYNCLNLEILEVDSDVAISGIKEGADFIPKALEKYEALRKKREKRERISCLNADLYFHSGKYREAEKEYNRLKRNNDQQKPYILYKLGLAKLHNSKYKSGFYNLIESLFLYSKEHHFHENEAYEVLTGLLGIPPETVRRQLEESTTKEFQRRTWKTYGKGKIAKAKPHVLDMHIRSAIENNLLNKALKLNQTLLDWQANLELSKGYRIHLANTLFLRGEIHAKREEWRQAIESYILAYVEDCLTYHDEEVVSQRPASSTLSRLHNASQDWLNKIGGYAKQRWNDKPQFDMIKNIHDDVLKEFSEEIEQKESIGDKADEAQSRRLRIRRRQRANKAKRISYLHERGIGEENNDRLVLLKRWNSVTPMIPFRKDKGPGGGIFIEWQGYGIAIDPGYDFIRQLYVKAGYTVGDIDYIVVTHAHDDHSAETESLYSIKYKLRKEAGESPNSNENPSFISSEGAAIKYAQLLKNINSETVTLTPNMTWPNRNAINYTPHVSIDGTPTVHNELPWMINNTGLGLVMTLKNGFSEEVRIGITSDTRFHDSLVSKFYDLDLMILHLGCYHNEDSQHLGAGNCGKLLDLTRPNVAVITEWDEDLKGERIAVLDEIKSSMNVQRQEAPSYKSLPELIPGDTGLILSLPELDIILRNGRRVSPSDLKFHEVGEEIVYSD